MRKILFITILLILGQASAQKKSILLQGGMALTSSKVDRIGTSTKTFSYTAMPRWGYQFTDHWTAGVQWSVGREKTETRTTVADTIIDHENKISNFSAGGFVRYTYPINEWFSAYADLDVGYQGAKTRMTEDNFFLSTSTSSTIKGSGCTATLTPAVCINIGAKGYKLNFSVGSVGYSQIDYEDNYGSNEGFGLNFGKSFTIGLSRNFQL